MKINVNNYQKRFLPREYKVQQWSHLKLILEGFVLYKIQQHYDAISSMGLKHWFSRMKYVTEHTQHLPTNQRMPALPNKLHLLKALPTLHTEPPPSYTRWDITPCWRGRSCQGRVEIWVCPVPRTWGEGWQLWKTVSEVLSPLHKEILGVLLDKNIIGLPKYYKNVPYCTV